MRAFVLDKAETAVFLERWFALLDLLLPNFLAEGKTQLNIALGCTGGQHRSVVLAERTADFVRSLGYPVAVSHRDIVKDRERADDGGARRSPSAEARAFRSCSAVCCAGGFDTTAVVTVADDGGSLRASPARTRHAAAG